MAASGANIVFTGRSRIGVLLLQKLGLRPNGVVHRAAPTADGTTSGRQIAVGYKQNATAPQSNTAADAPTGLGDLIVHLSAAGVVQAIYRCSAYTSSSSFTYTQIA